MHRDYCVSEMGGQTKSQYKFRRNKEGELDGDGAYYKNSKEYNSSTTNKSDSPLAAHESMIDPTMELKVSYCLSLFNY